MNDKYSKWDVLRRSGVMLNSTAYFAYEFPYLIVIMGIFPGEARCTRLADNLFAEHYMHASIELDGVGRSKAAL